MIYATWRLNVSLKVEESVQVSTEKYRQAYRKVQASTGKVQASTGKYRKVQASIQESTGNR